MILISKVEKNTRDGTSLLKKGSKYYGVVAPTMYDPNTLRPTARYYVVTCENGKSYKFLLSFFEDLGEYRTARLKDILS